MNYTTGVQNLAPLIDLQIFWIENGSSRGATLSPVCLFPKDGLRKRQENDVKGQQESVMAQLLRVRREVAVVPFDVRGDPAALAPPLITVGNQTGETVEGDVCPHLFYMMAFHCDPGGGWGGYLAWMF